MRVSLRDKFDAPTAPLRTALQSLTSLVGYELSPEIAWVDLWNSLSSYYSDDKAVFVSTITDAIILFLKRLEARLQDDEAFQEMFLEKMDSARKALYVQVRTLEMKMQNLTRFVRSMINLSPKLHSFEASYLPCISPTQEHPTIDPLALV